jgi:hypothetical protein
MKKPLQIALAKLRPFGNTKGWDACLAYSEILALLENGWKLRSLGREESYLVGRGGAKFVRGMSNVS